MKFLRVIAAVAISSGAASAVALTSATSPGAGGSHHLNAARAPGSPAGSAADSPGLYYHIDTPQASGAGDLANLYYHT